ncbi:Signal transduction histidine kinase [Geodermatophilus obscurus]|uniref:histidine kinase n=1 Tax=Geodermatophilus obscurus TaxID=1861 RepID=A0A1I5H6K4_9ACTN|nr:histidine kinase [Geodermatophilus obscurus]SFO43847.1 Signal transduction histidine kinase [Geodermatophilus obscurus]
MSTVTRAPSGGLEDPAVDPALLLADPAGAPDDVPRARRSPRDWIVDVVSFVATVAFAVGTLGEMTSRPVPPPDPLLLAELVVGLGSCVALWWRRRWPVAVAVGVTTVGALLDAGGAAILVALFTVAVHRRWPTVVAVTAVNAAAFAAYVAVRTVDGMPEPVFVSLGLALLAAVVSWGMFVRARRQLLASLRERAVRAEAEQRLRVEQARHLERSRIAREMHDVLAHRLSLLSMHAGALEFRPDAPAAEVARAAGVVRASARQALVDLRGVIGVLRDGADGEAPERPQPTLGDLPALVEELRQAGLRVQAEYRVADLGSVPAGTGRTAYRVVQEALTNVRRHAPGTVATVAVTGGPAQGLTVEVRNPAPAGGTPPALPSGGTGLIGVLERVSLAGGRLEHGWTPTGDFRVRVELPWSPATA